jgi:hypothetical protein
MIPEPPPASPALPARSRRHQPQARRRSRESQRAVGVGLSRRQPSAASLKDLRPELIGVRAAAPAMVRRPGGGYVSGRGLGRVGTLA